MKEKAISILLCITLLLLLVFAPAAASGAAKGLILWYRQVLPVLMPFTLIVQAMLSGGTVIWLSRITGPIITKSFGLSPACSFCILTGFLCGFPMGALTAASSLEQKLINREEAQLLAACCNNAGPMFLSSYILEQQLHAGSQRPVLTFIFYGSALLWMWIRSRFIHRKYADNAKIPGASSNPQKDISFRQILLNSSELMLKVGVFMMLFAILCEILAGFSGLSKPSSALIAMLLEITNGTAAIGQLQFSIQTKTVLTLGGAAFGGLCIAFQTYTVIHSQKLSFVKYLIDKMAISLTTISLTFLWFQITS